MQNERNFRIPKITGEKKANKTTQLQTHATFHEKERMSPKAEAQKEELRDMELFSGLKI